MTSTTTTHAGTCVPGDLDALLLVVRPAGGCSDPLPRRGARAPAPHAGWPAKTIVDDRPCGELDPGPCPAATAGGIDEGMSLRRKLRLGEVGRLFRQGVLAVLERLGVGREGLEAVAVELGDDDGDVVVPAGLVGALGELLASVDGLGRRAQHLADLVEADHAAQAVRAEHHHVALAQLAEGEVDLHGVGRAERLEDDVVVLERLGLFLGELAGLDELVDERLVARQLHQVALAQQVAPRVAHLGEEEVVVDQSGRGDGRPHPAARAIELRLLEDAQPGGLDGADEAPRELVALQRVVVARARRSCARRGCRPRAGWRSPPPPRPPIPSHTAKSDP